MDWGGSDDDYMAGGDDLVVETQMIAFDVPAISFPLCLVSPNDPTSKPPNNDNIFKMDSGLTITTNSCNRAAPNIRPFTANRHH